MRGRAAKVPVKFRFDSHPAERKPAPDHQTPDLDHFRRVEYTDSPGTTARELRFACRRTFARLRAPAENTFLLLCNCRAPGKRCQSRRCLAQSCFPFDWY